MQFTKKGKKLFRLIFIVGIFFCATQVRASECKPVVAVYPTWEHTEDIQKSLPWNRFTHLAVFGVYPNIDGELSSVDADKFIAPLVSLAHSKGKRVIVSVGGAGTASKAFRKIAENEALRTKFAENISSYVSLHKLDGVDIDWEYWTYQNELGKGGNDPVESKNLVKLIAEIRAALPEGILLTADIMAGSWVGEQYIPEIQEFVDYVNLMAFDFTGQWVGSNISHHSDYSTFKKSINYVINRGFSKEKILVGLPAYGKEFVDGKAQKVRNVAYREIVEMLDGDLSKINKGEFENIHFETKENIHDKSNYLQKNGFPGVFMFEVTSDHTQDAYSLLQVASNIINPKACYNKSIQPTANASAD